MIASKMNEIYPPSVNNIVKRCNEATPVSKQALIEMECRILNLINFDVAIQSHYNILCQILGQSKKDIEECEKLLKIIIYNKEINQNLSDIIAYAIIYLIARSKIDAELQGEMRTRVKVVAQKIYTYYKDMKKNHDAQKSRKDQTLTTETKTVEQRQL